MEARIPILIDGKQYSLVANDKEEDSCEKCAFYTERECPNNVCNFVFPRNAVYIEKV